MEAPFEPKPLLRLLEGRGYGARSTALAADHWRTEFYPAAEEDDAIVPLGTPATP